MSDNKQDRGPQDASRINIHEDYEVRYWTKALDVTKQECQRRTNFRPGGRSKTRPVTTMT